MKKYQITIMQDVETTYRGSFEIEAKNKEEAENIIASMTTEQLNNSVNNWEQSNYINEIIESTEVEQIKEIKQ